MYLLKNTKYKLTKLTFINRLNFKDSFDLLWVIMWHVLHLEKLGGDGINIGIVGKAVKVIESLD